MTVTTNRSAVTLVNLNDLVSRFSSDPFLVDVAVIFGGFTGTASFTNTSGSEIYNSVSITLLQGASLLGTAVNAGGYGRGSATFAQGGAGFVSPIAVFPSSLSLALQCSATSAAITYDLSVPVEIYCR
jgi:hypothetical protein